MRQFVVIFLLVCSIFLSGCRFQKNEEPDERAAFGESKGTVLNSRTPLLITPEAFNVLPVYCVEQQGRTPQPVLTYPFVIREDIDFSTLKIALQSEPSSDIRINGQSLEPIPATYFLTEDFRLYEIGPYVNRGVNSVQWYPVSDEQERDKKAFLLGAFRLQRGEKGYEIGLPVSLRLGNRNEQGLYFYPDAVSYSKIYRISENKCSYLLTLPEWKGKKATVYINKMRAGDIRQDSGLDITSFLIKGENLIDVRVFGYPENTLLPFTPGDHYQSPVLPDSLFLPVGLYEDFMIKQYQ